MLGNTYRGTVASSSASKNIYSYNLFAGREVKQSHWVNSQLHRRRLLAMALIKNPKQIQQNDENNQRNKITHHEYPNRKESAESF